METLATISGNIVDVLNDRTYPGTIYIKEGRIARITEDSARYSTYLIPGLIDAHVHVESSMLVPSEFARLAVRHGTVATVSDPHEIANVLGVKGVEYMVDNGSKVPFGFNFGAPSCVPATGSETSGAVLGPAEVEQLLQRDDIRYLSEVMNYPGILNEDAELLAKIESARKRGKPVDGHAPGLRGDALRKYVEAGITTDHETLDRDEAEEKIALGMKLLIREGSAAKEFDRFQDFMDRFPESCMLCSDDKHPDDLVRGHIDSLVRRALRSGNSQAKVLRCACVNPVLHYKLDTGLLQEGQPADVVEIDGFETFTILRTLIRGQVVAASGKSNIAHLDAPPVNVFNACPATVESLAVRYPGGSLQVVHALDGSLFTERLSITPTVSGDMVVSDPDRDILKIVVLNRYQAAAPAVGFVHGFDVRNGAIASSVAHDSHNVVAVGATDQDLCEAMNLVIENGGGMAAVGRGRRMVLPLPVAGLMSGRDGFEVADLYTALDGMAKDMGSTLSAPFMTLSFMALPVIPRLKMTDRGLFDVDAFQPTSLFV